VTKVLNVDRLQAPLSPSLVRYVKLGQGGRWEAASLDGGRIDWGLPSDPHEQALAEDWNAVREHYLAHGLNPATATAYVNETRAFYDSDPKVLWITFARGRLWWAFAKPQVHWIGGSGETQGTRYRTALDGWHDHDITGEPLDLERLSSSLTQLAGYRRTICRVKDAAYCLRMINAEPDPLLAQIEDARQKLEVLLASAIARLNWPDFELLAELILTRSGWRRITAIGGTMKDVDLVVEQPLTGERMLVQVKSKADQAVVDDYARRLSARAGEERLLLVCHSPEGQLREPELADRRLQIMARAEIARRAAGCDLVEWVIDRAR
jgi:hypothetical protein